MTKVKICGLAREDDARAAARFGADYLGFVLAESPRRCDPRRATLWVPRIREEFPHVELVGVFERPSAAEVDEQIEALGLDYVQIHGLRPDEGLVASRPVIRAIAADTWMGGEPNQSWAVLLDTPRGDRPSGTTGGTGRVWDWSLLREPRPERLFVAGGLDSENVGLAIRELRPYAVDAASRLESAPGRKDAALVRAFVDAARAADAALDADQRRGETNR